MSWNYRVIKTTEGSSSHYYLHEVYYDDAGQPDGSTVEPVFVSGENVEEIRQVLTQMLRDIKQPVLEERDGKLIEVKA